MQGAFKYHKFYAQAEDFNEQVNNRGAIPKLSFPIILFSTINARAFIGCFCEIFELSNRFTYIR
jgi:hypothetical protein